MKNFNFLPRWYINKKKNRINKAVSIINFMLIATGIFMSIVIYRSYIGYKEISNKKVELNRNINDMNDSLQVSKITAANDVKASKVYSEIRNEIGDRPFESIEISKNESKIKILHPNVEDYIVFIKSIEKGEKFEIVDLQPPAKHDNYIDNLITIKYKK